jgi:predicted GNAT superfamily acetyltransferase
LESKSSKAIAMSEIQIEELNGLRGKPLLEVVELEKAIFPEPLSRETLERETAGRKGLLVLIAYEAGHGGRAIGYKIGYEQSSKRLYSWIGGVHPDCRGRGVAKALMQRQLDRAREAGYRFVTTHTANRFRDMLVLNIKSGFDIVGLKKNSDLDEQSIILEKRL